MVLETFNDGTLSSLMLQRLVYRGVHQKPSKFHGVQSDLCNNIFCNYPFDSTILPDLILTLCNDWMWTSCLAAVKMLCVIERGGVY